MIKKEDCDKLICHHCRKPIERETEAYTIQKIVTHSRDRERNTTMTSYSSNKKYSFGAKTIFCVVSFHVGCFEVIATEEYMFDGDV
jgi:phage terminase large subunit GpA-like protein